MQEKDLNGIIRKSFEQQGGFGFKIADSGSYNNGYVTHSKNPADGIAFYNRKFVMWESKFLNKPKALSLDKLETHQLESLQKTKKLLDESYALFLVGVNYGIKDKRVYIFTDLDYIEYRRNNKESIKKKEFDNLKNYVKINSGIIDIKQLLEASQFEPHLNESERKN